MRHFRRRIIQPDVVRLHKRAINSHYIHVFKWSQSKCKDSQAFYMYAILFWTIDVSHQLTLSLRGLSWQVD